jgi:hypothetical protein
MQIVGHGFATPFTGDRLGRSLYLAGRCALDGLGADPTEDQHPEGIRRRPPEIEE